MYFALSDALANCCHHSTWHWSLLPHVGCTGQLLSSLYVTLVTVTSCGMHWPAVVITLRDIGHCYLMWDVLANCCHHSTWHWSLLPHVGCTGQLLSSLYVTLVTGQLLSSFYVTLVTVTSCGIHWPAVVITLRDIGHCYLMWDVLASCCHHSTWHWSLLPHVGCTGQLLSSLYVTLVTVTSCGMYWPAVVITLRDIGHCYLMWDVLASCCHHSTWHWSLLPHVGCTGQLLSSLYVTLVTVTSCGMYWPAVVITLRDIGHWPAVVITLRDIGHWPAVVITLRDIGHWAESWEHTQINWRVKSLNCRSLK